MKKNKIIVQIIVVALIIGAIVYIEAGKSRTPASAVKDVTVTYASSTYASSTYASSTYASSTYSTTATTSISTNPTHNPGMIPTSDSALAPSSATATAARVSEKAAKYSKAKELVDPAGFINSPNGNVTTWGTSTEPAPGAGMNIGNAPFTLSQFAGNKVVLLDFWTYSCINCERTIPYLNAWYQKYKDEGLVIVGVHSPEFDFEKNYANVAAAVKQYGIDYPVVLDSDMGTWNAYQNQYWPEEYLIDIDGFVVHNSIGEGNYAETEAAIQAALKERDQVLGLPDTVSGGTVNPANAIPMDATEIQSPETYFGSNRNEYLANGEQGVSGLQTLSVPAAPNNSSTVVQANSLYLGGTWDFQPEFAESTGTSSKIVYIYDAKNVYFVAAATSSAASPASANGVKINLILDGVSQGSMTIQANKLYTLVQGTDYGEHTLEIDVTGPGLDAYTFTFG